MSDSGDMRDLLLLESRAKITKRKNSVVTRTARATLNMLGRFSGFERIIVTCLPTINIAVARDHQGANSMACSLRRRVRGGFSPPSL